MVAHQAAVMVFARESGTNESSEVEKLVRGTYISRDIFLALAMLVLYDNVCTMDKEVSIVI